MTDNSDIWYDKQLSLKALPKHLDWFPILKSDFEAVTLPE